MGTEGRPPPWIADRVAELRAVAAVMREMGVTEAYGFKLGEPPSAGKKPPKATAEDREEEAEAIFLRKVKALTGGTPSPELADKLRRIIR